MEQHAVPRNISGFQFRLIGDMTLRQFTYLSAGVGLGYLFYRISPLPGMVTFLISGTMALIGFAFAFLPIQERPLDKWLAVFIKSILSPTRFLWQKNNLAPEILLRPAVAQTKVVSPVYYQVQKDAREKLHAYLATLPTSPHEVLNREEKNYVDKTLAMFDFVPVVSVSVQNIDRPVSAPILPVQKPTYAKSDLAYAASDAVNAGQPVIAEPTPATISSPVPLETITPMPTILPQEKITVSYQGASLQLKPSAVPFLPVQAKSDLTQAKSDLAQASSPPDEQRRLADQLQKTLKEKGALEQQLKKLQADLTNESTPQVIKPQPDTEEKRGPTVYTVRPQEVRTEIGIPLLPQTPNILSGVVKDPQKKMLPNIIITIKDKSTMPLRALKTNKLGQFATATPLPNGTYLVCSEDTLKRYVFDIAQISLSGKVFMPIEIIAKGEKELIRERLSKQLFGNVNI